MASSESPPNSKKSACVDRDEASMPSSTPNTFRMLCTTWSNKDTAEGNEGSGIEVCCGVDTPLLAALLAPLLLQPLPLLKPLP